MRRVLPVVMLALLVPALQGCSLFSCGDEVTARAVSPDRRWLAAVLVRNCGATTDFATHVTIVEAADEPDDSGDIFVAEAGGAPQAPKGGPEIRLRWLGPDHLLVAYDVRAEVFHQVVRRRGLRIDYRPEGRAP